MVSFLCGLSKFVALPLLTEWLVVEDVCRVDTAFCNSEGRLLILLLLENEFVNFTARDNPKVIRYYLQWLILRAMHVRRLIIKANGIQLFDQESLTCLKDLDELKFSFSSSSGLHMVTLNKVVQTASNLQSICFADAQVLNNNILFSIADNCRQLKSFRCSKGITSIKTTMASSAMVYFVTHCPLLTTLGLNGMRYLIDDDFVEVMVVNCPDLREISISDSYLTRKSIELLVNVSCISVDLK